MNPQIIPDKGKGLAFPITSPGTALGQSSDGGKLVLSLCNYKLLFLEVHWSGEVVSNSSIKVSAGLVKSKSC